MRDQPATWTPAIISQYIISMLLAGLESVWSPDSASFVPFFLPIKYGHPGI
jgi:hypothetical protein